MYILTHTHTHTHTHTLTYSLIHSLTHSLTHSLSHTHTVLQTYTVLKPLSANVRLKLSLKPGTDMNVPQVYIVYTLHTSTVGIMQRVSSAKYTYMPCKYVLLMYAVSMTFMYDVYIYTCMCRYHWMLMWAIL